MSGIGGFPSDVYGLDSFPGLLRAAVAVAAVGMLVHLGARRLLGRSTPVEGITTAFLAGFGSFVVHGLVRIEWLAWTLALAVFMLVAMLVYRVRAAKGAGVGAAAFALWAVAGLLLHALVGAAA